MIMKLKNILPLFFIANACVAMPIIEEKFDNGDVSQKFLDNFRISENRTNVEPMKNGDYAMTFDYMKNSGGYPMALRYPKKSSSAYLGKKMYEVSFDYKILSLNGVGDCVAAIQRSSGNEIKNDSVVYFGGKKGETGRVVLYSNTFADIDKAYFFVSPKDSKIKFAIDNFTIKEIPVSDWFFDKKYRLWGMRSYPFTGHFLVQNKHLLSMSAEEFFPFIDKFGQFKHKEWQNKVHSIEDLKKRTEEENAFNAKLGDIPNRDKYFGYVNENHKYKATGRFRTEKIDGKWYLITPEGNLFWSMGVNAIGLYQATPISKREHYFEDINGKKYIRFSRQTRHIFKEPYNTFCFEWRNLDWKYGNDWRNQYGKVVEQRTRKWGVNTMGGWVQNFVFNKVQIPFTHMMNSVKGVSIKSKSKLVAHWIDVPDYFDPKFRSKTLERFQKDYNKKVLLNPYCIAVFVDNELPWQPRDYMLAKAILQSGEKQYAKIKFADVLKQKYETIEALNKAWNAKYKSWEDFLVVDSFLPKTKASLKDMLNIEELYYRTYFSTCRDAVKMASPDALYISCRFAWGNQNVKRIATEYCDILAINYYKKTPLTIVYPKGGKDVPIIIGEYHFGNQDRGVFGGGLVACKTMKERIKANNKYIEDALSHPNIVGAHWFRWADQITSGRQNDGENFSCGMVDICDTPQYDFVMSVRKLSEDMYEKRLGEK